MDDEPVKELIKIVPTSELFNKISIQSELGSGYANTEYTTEYESMLNSSDIETVSLYNEYNHYDKSINPNIYLNNIEAMLKHINIALSNRKQAGLDVTNLENNYLIAKRVFERLYPYKEGIKKEDQSAIRNHIKGLYDMVNNLYYDVFDRFYELDNTINSLDVLPESYDVDDNLYNEYMNTNLKHYKKTDNKVSNRLKMIEDNINPYGEYNGDDNMVIFDKARDGTYFLVYTCPYSGYEKTLVINKKGNKVSVLNGDTIGSFEGLGEVTDVNPSKSFLEELLPYIVNSERNRLLVYDKINPDVKKIATNVVRTGSWYFVNPFDNRTPAGRVGNDIVMFLTMGALALGGLFIVDYLTKKR